MIANIAFVCTIISGLAALVWLLQQPKVTMKPAIKTILLSISLLMILLPIMFYTLWQNEKEHTLHIELLQEKRISDNAKVVNENWILKDSINRSKISQILEVSSFKEQIYSLKDSISKNLAEFNQIIEDADLRYNSKVDSILSDSNILEEKKDVLIAHLKTEHAKEVQFLSSKMLENETKFNEMIFLKDLQISNIEAENSVLNDSLRANSKVILEQEQQIAYLELKVEDQQLTRQGINILENVVLKIECAKNIKRKKKREEAFNEVLSLIKYGKSISSQNNDAFAFYEHLVLKKIDGLDEDHLVKMTAD